VSPGTETWQPEKVDAYEIGAKYDLRGEVHGYFNIAAFYNHFTNQQISGSLIAKPDSGQVGGLAIINAGTSRIDGIEADMSIVPIKHLRFDLGYTYLSTKVTAITLPTLPANSPFSEVIPSATVGDPLTQSPKDRVTVSGTYTLPLAGNAGNVSFGAVFTHTDSQVAAGGLDGPYGLIPATNLLNLNLTWDHVLGRPLEIGLFGTNVTNQIYPISISEDFAAFGFETTYYGPPRMYGVRLRYSFGE
jgi:iron complex outermembrane receptor protein